MSRIEDLERIFLLFCSWYFCTTFILSFLCSRSLDSQWYQRSKQFLPILLSCKIQGFSNTRRLLLSHEAIWLDLLLLWSKSSLSVRCLWKILNLFISVIANEEHLLNSPRLFTINARNQHLSLFFRSVIMKYLVLSSLICCELILSDHMFLARIFSILFPEY